MTSTNNKTQGTQTQQRRYFDKEYQTMYGKEVYYLLDRGINYTFVKTNPDGVKVYKYTRTSELFSALADFYNELENK